MTSGVVSGCRAVSLQAESERVVDGARETDLEVFKGCFGVNWAA